MKKIIAVLLFLSGCISGSVEIQSACYNTLVDFDGVPANTEAAVLIPIIREFKIHIGNVADWVNQVMIIDGALTAVSIEDFSFINELMISVYNPVAGDDLVLWDIQQPQGQTLNIVAGDNNLINYIDNDGYLTLKITLASSNPPPERWVINANLCAKIDIAKRYGL